ncbi:MAG: glycoside hydrolase [Puniceicoccaceae bacterium 5H]|nr:MAG: glycoside hydrolase [Puniceicoccaceae bacterium 5H]
MTIPNPLRFASCLLFAGLPLMARPANNPVIWADVPDPAVIRVGDTYYMSSTTMHMSPGLPLMKSHNLVDWELIGYAYDELDEDNAALNLEDGQNAYGKGSWASSLRYHDGLYYVSTFSSTTGKTYVFTTPDIEKGDWQEHTFSPSLHDHSLFFDDDGRVYMVYAGGDIRLRELTSDASGLKPGGIDRVIVPNASEVAGKNVGLPAEGSQLLKVGDYYYLLNITWPKNGMRTVLVHRAKQITGPYEGRVALQDRGIAQGCLIDTPEGKWYGFLFRDYGAVGRIPYLVPVKWEDGWPVFGIDGKVPDALPIETSGQMDAIVGSDDFEHRELPLFWQWNHQPAEEAWSLTARPGYLRLETSHVVDALPQARNTLTQRTYGPQSAAETVLDVAHMQPGDVAGLTLLQQKHGYIAVVAEPEGKAIVMVNAESGKPREVARVPLEQDTIYLKAVGDFRDRADLGTFQFSLDGQSWQPLGNELHMEYTLPHFMGYRFGLFNYATQRTGGYVDFSAFRTYQPGARE